MKIKELLKNGIDLLKKAEIEEAILKARILLEYEVGVPKQYIPMHLEDEIPQKIVENFKNNIKFLVMGKPIQYITNLQNFYGLEFYVDENVLIPQPDTEILVEEVISIAKNKSLDVKILDICTGSGAIAVSLANNLQLSITASDISKIALEVARKNAQKHSANITFMQSDMFENISEKFDIIVSNPPYIETETIKTLPVEVKNEPRIALDGGKDGLHFYRILADKSRNYLKSGGILALEIGFNQRESVIQILENCGYSDIYSKKDYGDNDRIVVGKWG